MNRLRDVTGRVSNLISKKFNCLVFAISKILTDFYTSSLTNFNFSSVPPHPPFKYMFQKWL